MPFKVPAPPWYGTVFYRHNTGHGFSESYWLKKAGITDAMTDLIALTTIRRAMFDKDCRVLFWRVSDSNLKGDTHVQKASASVVGTYGTPQPPDNEADMMPVEVALKLRMQYTERYYATRLLRMLPEDCITDGEWTPTAAMTTAMTNFETALLANTVGLFKGIHETPPVTTPVQKDLNTVIPLSISTRRTGRPFGLRRGRSVLR